MLARRLSLSLLLPLLGLIACDGDDDGGEAQPPAPDARVDAARPDGSVGPEITSYIFTMMDLKTPEALAPLMNQLLNTYLDRGALFLFVRVSLAEDGAARVEGGAAQPIEGGEAFTWLTEGECLDGEGALSPCSVEVGRAEAEWSGDEGSVRLPILSIYSEELHTIFPIRAVDISCAREGADLRCEMLGSITQEDAKRSWIRLTPSSPSVLLEDLMQQVGLTPEVEVDGLPAYAFGGLIEATEAPFSAP